MNYRLHYTEEDTGEAENFSKIRGIVLKNHGDRKYAAVWDDMPADVEHMKIWERKEEPIEMEEEAEEEEEKEAEKSEVEEKVDEREELEDSSKTCEIQEETEALACEPIGRYHARKIQRKELSRLPRCEWKLSNNQSCFSGGGADDVPWSSGYLPRRRSQGSRGIWFSAVYSAYRNRS